MWIWENSLEKSELISKKSIHSFSDSDNSFNHWMNSCKKSRSNTFIRRFLQCISFHTQGKDGANAFHI